MSNTRHDEPTKPSPRVRRSVSRLLGAVDRLIAAADEARRARDELRRLADAEPQGVAHVE